MSGDVGDEKWVSYAEEDWRYALLGLETLPRPAVWSLQQAAEKYLKAVLPHLDKEPPRTHDLLYLLKRIEENPTPELLEAAALLNLYGPTRRYPGDLPEVRTDEAMEAKAAADQLRAWAREKLGLLA